MASNFRLWFFSSVYCALWAIQGEACAPAHHTPVTMQEDSGANLQCTGGPQSVCFDPNCWCDPSLTAECMNSADCATSIECVLGTSFPNQGIPWYGNKEGGANSHRLLNRDGCINSNNVVCCY